MVFRYLSLFLLYINIKIGKNRYLMLDWQMATCMGNSFHLAVAGGVSLMVPFPTRCLDEIWEI